MKKTKKLAAKKRQEKSIERGGEATPQPKRTFDPAHPATTFYVIDESNLFLVATRGDMVVQMRAKSPLTPEEAANLAAWLLVLSGCPKDDFAAAVEAIEAT